MEYSRDELVAYSAECKFLRDHIAEAVNKALVTRQGTDDQLEKEMLTQQCESAAQVAARLSIIILEVESLIDGEVEFEYEEETPLEQFTNAVQFVCNWSFLLVGVGVALKYLAG